MGFKLSFGHANAPGAGFVPEEATPTVRFPSCAGFGRSDGENTIHCSFNLPLDDLRDAVGAVLDCPVELIEPMAFEQTAGGGLELHSDHVAVVSWQIKGAKRWRFYPASQMPPDLRALRVAFPKEGGGPIVANFYRTASFTDGSEKELLPGDFVVMPAFTLHETRAVTDGVSVSATVKMQPRR